MPAWLTITIVGASGALFLALLLAAGDLKRGAAIADQLHAEHAARRAARPGSNVILFPARRPFDWQVDAPDLDGPA